MNTHTSSLKHVSPKVAGLRVARRARGLVVVALVAAPALFPQTAPRAQRGKQEGASLTGVSASRQGGETTVSISGEGAMNRVQTWQDADGFHVVFPNGKGAPGRLPKGVRTQRVGNSLELVVPTRPGASVTVQPGAGRLDLVVSGDLDEGSGATGATPAAGASAKSRRAETRERGAVEGQEQQQRRSDENAARRASESEDRATQKRGEQAAAGNSSERASASEGAASKTAQSGAASNSDTTANPEAVNAPPAGPQTVDATAAAAQTKLDAQAADSSFLSATGLLLLLAVAGLGGGLYFVRRRRASGASVGVGKEKQAKKENEKKSDAPVKQDALVKVEAAKPVEAFELPPPFEHTMGDRRRGNVPVAQDRRRSGAGATDVGTHFNLTAGGALAPDGTGGAPERKPETRSAQQWNTPTVLFGAYRIEQEVCKLVQGEPHSIDVLASRAVDDRRAIETSLVKALNSHKTGEDALWRVRQALEDYGFVARQSASLLLSTDAYERVSAARVLGQIKSVSSLPFLLEALYDVTPVVRTEVVASLGALGLPRAIGALIDMARRYPEVPESLIAPALTACSFEAQEWAWNALTDARANDITGEHAAGGPPRPDSWVGVDELPEWLEAESLADALEHLESADVEARIAAVQSLAQFPARRSVDALTAILVRDENAAVRAAAVTSLAAIDHETVFAPVLYALADDAREVRAAAARAYSGATYDRADASARLAETADRETLEDLARACVKSGMAAQAVGRLASEDGRQAYEAFSMLSLVVRGGETAPVVETVAGHRDMSVRLAAVRLACLTGHAGLLQSLRELAASGRLPENLRAAILDASEQNAQTHR